MKQRISKSAFFKACRGPRQRFRKLSIDNSGRVSVRAPFPDLWQCVWFELNQVHEDDGTYYFDDGFYSAYMFVDGVWSAVFYVEAGSVLSVSYSVQLSKPQLDAAVRALEGAGLGEFVAPAAKQALLHAPEGARKLLGSTLRSLTRRTSRAPRRE